MPASANHPPSSRLERKPRRDQQLQNSVRVGLTFGALGPGWVHRPICGGDEQRQTVWRGGGTAARILGYGFGIERRSKLSGFGLHGGGTTIASLVTAGVLPFLRIQLTYSCSCSAPVQGFQSEFSLATRNTERIEHGSAGGRAVSSRWICVAIGYCKWSVDRVKPARRPFFAVTRANLRLASSIISPLSMAAPLAPPSAERWKSYASRMDSALS